MTGLRSSLWGALIFSLFLLGGCTRWVQREGDNPGECRDGADNDSDGLFDCEDPDCERSPDCASTDADGDSDGDGDADGDSDIDGDSDGDGDADADVDGDADVDVDGDADVDGEDDLDADPDGVRACDGPNDCVDLPARPHCLLPDGRCVGCLEPEHCTTQPAPRCDLATYECVPCLENEDCRIEGMSVCTEERECVQCTAEHDAFCVERETFCLAEEQNCVECLTNSDCVLPEASRCVEMGAGDRECLPCREDGFPEDCEGFGEGGCVEGVCRECSEYEHCSISDGLICNLSQLRCVEACRLCVADAECGILGGGFHCVIDSPALLPGVSHCAQETLEGECPRPWISERRTYSGGDEYNFCVPPPTTTCLGIVEFGDSDICGGGAASCGDDSLADDGLCSGGVCTYGCLDEGVEHDEWCPTGSRCEGASGCEPPRGE